MLLKTNIFQQATVPLNQTQWSETYLASKYQQQSVVGARNFAMAQHRGALWAFDYGRHSCWERQRRQTKSGLNKKARKNDSSEAEGLHTGFCFHTHWHCVPTKHSPFPPFSLSGMPTVSIPLLLPILLLMFDSSLWRRNSTSEQYGISLVLN